MCFGLGGFEECGATPDVFWCVVYPVTDELEEFGDILE